MASVFLPFLSQTSGEAEQSEPAGRCRGGWASTVQEPCWGHRVSPTPSVRPRVLEGWGAKWCIRWCQAWASQPWKESPKRASPPPRPPAPAAVSGRGLEGGRADGELSSRVHGLPCLLSWLQGKAVVLLSLPGAQPRLRAVPWLSEPDSGQRGWRPSKGNCSARTDPAGWPGSLRPQELSSRAARALAGHGGSDALADDSLCLQTSSGITPSFPWHARRCGDLFVGCAAYCVTELMFAFRK